MKGGWVCKKISRKYIKPQKSTIQLKYKNLKTTKIYIRKRRRTQNEQKDKKEKKT